MKLALLACALLTSCELGPSLVTRPDGTRIATTGAKLGIRAKAQIARVILPDGTVLEQSGDSDGTGIPRASMTTGLMGKGIDAAPTLIKSARQ